MDGVIILSQLNSLLQLANGNHQQALYSQLQFLSKFIILSQLKCIYHYVRGDHLLLLITWITFCEYLNLIIQTLSISFAYFSPYFFLGLIHWIGFSRLGITPGSLASMWKSYYGTSSNLFLNLQLIGQSQILPFTLSLFSTIFGAALGPLPVLVYPYMKKAMCDLIRINSEERLLACDDDQIETESLISLTQPSLD
jgi:hypothetical protein